MGHGQHMGSMKKMKSNQDGGSVTAKDPKAAADQIKSIEKKEGAGKMKNKISFGGKKEAAGKMKYDGSGKHHGGMKHHGSMKHHGGMKHHGSMKMGYAQKLGKERISPGKMGDEAAMKMMHGDAASKSYDGSGKYMNGSPKYIGASKGYGVPKMMMGPADQGHLGDFPGHKHPTNVQTTVSSAGGGSSSVSNTTSSGGGTGVSFTKAYEKADKGKYPTFESFKKAAEDYNKSKVTTTSQPTRKSSIKEEKIVDPRSLSEEKEKARIENQNRKNTFQFKQEQADIRAFRDSTITDQNFRKRYPLHRQDDPDVDLKAKFHGTNVANQRRVQSETYSPTESKQKSYAGFGGIMNYLRAGRGEEPKK